MGLERLFSETKWDMIILLAEKERSPLELAEQLETSLANVSQQLRLLELSGLVTKRRTGEAARGKPRVIFSIKKDCAFIVMMSRGNAKKQLVELDDRRRKVLEEWMSP